MKKQEKTVWACQVSFKKVSTLPQQNTFKNVGIWKDIVPLNFNKVERYYNKYLPKHTIQLERGYFFRLR